MLTLNPKTGACERLRIRRELELRAPLPVHRKSGQASRHSGARRSGGQVSGQIERFAGVLRYCDWHVSRLIAGGWCIGVPVTGVPVTGVPVTVHSISLPARRPSTSHGASTQSRPSRHPAPCHPAWQWQAADILRRWRLCALSRPAGRSGGTRACADLVLLPDAKPLAFRLMAPEGW